MSLSDVIALKEQDRKKNRKRKKKRKGHGFNVRGMAYILYGFGLGKRERSAEMSGAPKGFLHSWQNTSQLTEPVPPPGEQGEGAASQPGGRAGAAALDPKASSLSNVHPEWPAEGVSRKYLIKRKLFHFNTRQTVGALTVSPSPRHRWTMKARHGLCRPVPIATGSFYGACWRDQKFRFCFVERFKWTLCSSESKRKAPGITSLCCLLNSPFVSKRVWKKIFTVHTLFTISLSRA